MEEGRRRYANEAPAADKGAGGKLSSRPFRRRSTPYDRSPLAAKSKNGWFSKLVIKPASKILHLPSLFPSSSSSSSTKNQDQDQFQSRSEVEQEGATVCTLISDTQFFEPKDSPRHQKVDSKGNDSGIAEIEQQLQEKKFSRDETNHLLELLRSRTTDLPDKDGQAARLNASEVLPGQKNVRRSAKDYGVQFDSRMIPKTSNKSKFTVQDGGSSPIEIAKAYMEGRTSTSGYGCQTGRSKSERNLFYTDSSASKLSFTPAVKSPLCWPGAVVQSDQGYSTPQRESIMSLPRTPYSGALFSKSTSKFSVNAERANHSPTGRSSTHVFGHNTRTSTRMKSKTEDAFVSVSPAHHIFQKNIASTSKGAGPSNLATSFSLPSHSSDTSSSLSSAFERKPEHGPSKGGYSVDTTPVHPQSSELARKILEHLDRAVPSPKEKLLEITLARKRVPPEAETASVDGQHDKRDVSISDEKKSGSLLGRDVGSQETADSQKVLSGQPTGAFDDKGQLSSLPHSNNRNISGLLQNSTAINFTSQISNHLSHFSQPTAISVTKSTEKLISSDNGFSFSFPIPVTSAAISEPPPAPIITSQSTTSTRMEVGEESIPSFKFGSSDSEPCNRLVFSFGSTASSSNTDIPTPDFKIGTGKKRDLSFKLIGANGICY